MIKCFFKYIKNMNGLLLSLLLFSIISMASILAFSPYLFPKEANKSSEDKPSEMVETSIPLINSTENEIEEEISEKIEKTTISEETENDKIIWNFLKNNNLTDEGTAGLMGNLYAESQLKSVIYQNSYKETVGLTDQQYVDKVNDGTYTNFIDDKVGFGLA